MPRTRYTGPRTPRKRKVWANVVSQHQLTSSSPFVADSILGPFLADVGLTYAQGVTVMRLFGNVYLANETSVATTADWLKIGLGFAWVPQAIAQASAGDSQIPEPFVDGVREDRWYHQFVLAGEEEATAAQSGKPMSPIELSLHQFDSRNMQRQPTVNHQFCLIGNLLEGTPETNVTVIRWELSVLLALP